MADRMGADRHRSRRIAVPFTAAVLCVVAAAVLGLWATVPNLHWYAGLRRPSFRPPVVGFGVVWLVLQGGMIVAFTRVLRSPDWMPDRPAAVRAFFLQIAVQAVWPVAMFGLHRPKLGLAVALVLALQLASTARVFSRIDRLAGALVLPGLAWTGFVVLVNLSIAIRN